MNSEGDLESDRSHLENIEESTGLISIGVEDLGPEHDHKKGRGSKPCCSFDSLSR